MARPERRNADYFPFYAKDGRTLFLLESKYDCKGTGFFTNVMRFLTLEPDHHICIADEVDKLYFFSKCKCDDQSAAAMLDLMAKCRKIDPDLWVSSAVIVSEDLLASLSDAYRKRSNEIITIDEIRAKYKNSSTNPQNSGKNPKNSDDNTASQTEPSQNSGKNPQSKVKKSKVKKRGTIVPLCPHEEIKQSFLDNCPSLPRVQSYNDDLKKRVLARWKEDPRRQCLEWWDWYFSNVELSDWLTGRAKRGNGWRADFDWLVGPENMSKVLNGRFLNRVSNMDQAIQEFINGQPGQS